MDFSEIWWVLYVNELESEKNFDHHSVLPVFEEQVRCHAPMSHKTARVGDTLLVMVAVYFRYIVFLQVTVSIDFKR